MNIYHAIFAAAVVSMVALAAYATSEISPNVTLTTSQLGSTVTRISTTTVSGTRIITTLVTTSTVSAPTATLQVTRNSTVTSTVTQNDTVYSTRTRTSTQYSTTTQVSNVTQVSTSYVPEVETVATSVGNSNYEDCQYTTCMLNMVVSVDNGNLTMIPGSGGEEAYVTGDTSITINASAWIIDPQNAYRGYIPLYNFPLNVTYLGASGVTAYSDIVTGQDGTVLTQYTVPCGFVGKQFTLLLTPAVQGNYQTLGSGKLPELAMQIVPGGC